MLSAQLNDLMVFFLAAFVAAALLRGFLSALNIRHLRRHGHEIPEVFGETIDAETLAKISRYTLDSSRFGTLEGLFDDILTLLVLLSGLLPALLGLLPSWEDHFILTGLLFFGLLALASGLIGIPFDLYRTFVIERRHGFSTITLRLWVIDLFKGLGVSAVLMGALLAGFLALMQFTPQTWWFWTWLLVAAFQLIMLWLYPVVIAPLFNKFEPVKDSNLRDAIVALMAKVELKTEGVYQVDAGKRSRHTNAYFTGLGKTKRIVLYDTLIASHTKEEIVAVLAHEIGHWRGRHILKQLLFMEAASFVVLWLASHLVAWPLLYETFGFDRPVPFVGLLLAAILAGPLTLFFTPAVSAVLRRFEREADASVAGLTGTTAPLVSALKRLARDNLANLHPHPLYARVYYSHPPLAERIASLTAASEPKNAL
ncbi:MAG: M48 family metallopeptidase [Deltaproteobacteria bacterium]|nr:M48 family metallopeptidase [Deltaproteobacteria bacterium]